MATRSAKSHRHADDDAIIYLAPRRQLRLYVHELLTSLAQWSPAPTGYSMAGIRAKLAEADALFHDHLVVEFVRVIEREPGRTGIGIVLLLRLLGTDAAIDALFTVARGSHYPSWLQLDALRALRQLGAGVDISEIVALASTCDQTPIQPIVRPRHIFAIDQI